MARHWSAYVRTASERQAYALDRMAAESDDPELQDGMDLLMKLRGCSRSKIGKLDGLTMRHLVDQAFAEYGRARSS